MQTNLSILGDPPNGKIVFKPEVITDVSCLGVDFAYMILGEVSKGIGSMLQEKKS